MKRELEELRAQNAALAELVRVFARAANSREDSPFASQGWQAFHQLPEAIQTEIEGYEHFRDRHEWAPIFARAFPAGELPPFDENDEGPPFVDLDADT